jgi:hypothetical protein
MAVRIRSLLVSGPLLVPLSGGGTLRLSPGEVTDELPDVEVANNAKVDLLRAQRQIDVEESSTTGKSSSTDKSSTTDKSSSTDDEDGEPDDESAAPKTPRRTNRSR